MLNQVQQMNQQGNNPQAILNMLIQQDPQNQFLRNVRGKSINEIEEYASNLTQTMGLG